MSESENGGQDMSTPYFAEGTPAMVELEAMVDAAGLNNLLYALAHVCRMKADHVQINWQDAPLARMWGDNANKIERVIRTLKPTE